MRTLVDVASLYTKWRTHTTFRPASTLAMRARCAPALELGETLSSSVLNLAWECCYLKLLVALLRFGFDGVRSPYICCSLCSVVVLLKFSLFLFCSLFSSFSCCLQVAPSLATWLSLVSLSAASELLSSAHPTIVIPVYCDSFSFLFFSSS